MKKGRYRSHIETVTKRVTTYYTYNILCSYRNENLHGGVL